MKITQRWVWRDLNMNGTPIKPRSFPFLLVYKGKHEAENYLIENDEDITKALVHIFHMLKDLGCYDDAENIPTTDKEITRFVWNRRHNEYENIDVEYLKRYK